MSDIDFTWAMVYAPLILVAIFAVGMVLLWAESRVPYGRPRLQATIAWCSLVVFVMFALLFVVWLAVGVLSIMLDVVPVRW